MVVRVCRLKIVESLEEHSVFGKVAQEGHLACKQLLILITNLWKPVCAVYYLIYKVQPSGLTNYINFVIASLIYWSSLQLQSLV